VTIFIPEGNAQATMVFSGPTDTGNAITTFGFSLGEEGTLTGLCNAIGASFIAELLPSLSNRYTLTKVEAISATESAEVVFNAEGDQAGMPPAPNTCLLGRKGTSLRGRKHRGRNYWPGMITESMVDESGFISAGPLEGLQGAFDLWGASIDGLGYFGCILHNDEETEPTGITSYILDSKVATQRRRMR